MPYLKTPLYKNPNVCGTVMNANKKNIITMKIMKSSSFTVIVSSCSKVLQLGFLFSLAGLEVIVFLLALATFYT